MPYLLALQTLPVFPYLVNGAVALCLRRLPVLSVRCSPLAPLPCLVSLRRKAKSRVPAGMSHLRDKHEVQSKEDIFYEARRTYLLHR